MINPTNITKTVSTYYNIAKRVFGGYGFAQYGASVYGNSGGSSPINLSKYQPSAGSLLLQDGGYLLLQDGGQILLAQGGWVNQVKS